MKGLMKGILGAFAAAVFVTSFVGDAQACTGLYVGKDVSSDGTVIIGRTNDYEPGMLQYMNVVEAGEYKAGDTLSQLNGFEYCLPEDCFKYTYYKTMDYFVDESDIYSYPDDACASNECGVSINATITALAGDAALEADPYAADGIGEELICQVLAANSSTARQAVELLAQLVDEYGSQDSNIVLISDQNEAWYMEIYTGHQYAAVKLSDDVVTVFGNEFILKTVDPEEEDTIVSADLYKLAEDNNFIVYNDDEEIDLLKTYSPEEFDDDIHMRTWIGHELLAPSQSTEYSTDVVIPDFYEPDEKVSLEDVFEILRNRYEGTEYCPEETENYDVRCIAGQTNGGAYVIQTYSDVPANMSVVTWATPANVSFTPFMPLSNAAASVPEAYGMNMAEDGYNAECAQMVYANLANLCYPHRISNGGAVRKYWEINETIMVKDMSENVYEWAQSIQRSESATISKIDKYTKDLYEQSLVNCRDLTEDLSWHMIRNGIPAKSFTESELVEYGYAYEIYYDLEALASDFGWELSADGDVYTAERDGKTIVIDSSDEGSVTFYGFSDEELALILEESEVLADDAEPAEIEEIEEAENTEEIEEADKIGEIEDAEALDYFDEENEEYDEALASADEEAADEDDADAADANVIYEDEADADEIDADELTENLRIRRENQKELAEDKRNLGKADADESSDADETLDADKTSDRDETSDADKASDLNEKTEPDAAEASENLRIRKENQEELAEDKRSLGMVKSAVTELSDFEEGMTYALNNYFAGILDELPEENMTREEAEEALIEVAENSIEIIEDYLGKSIDEVTFEDVAQSDEAEELKGALSAAGLEAMDILSEYYDEEMADALYEAGKNITPEEFEEIIETYSADAVVMVTAYIDEALSDVLNTDLSREEVEEILGELSENAKALMEEYLGFSIDSIDIDIDLDELGIDLTDAEALEILENLDADVLDGLSALLGIDVEEKIEEYAEAVEAATGIEVPGKTQVNSKKYYATKAPEKYTQLVLKNALGEDVVMDDRETPVIRVAAEDNDNNDNNDNKNSSDLEDEKINADDAKTGDKACDDCADCDNCDNCVNCDDCDDCDDCDEIACDDCDKSDCDDCDDAEEKGESFELTPELIAAIERYIDEQCGVNSNIADDEGVTFDGVGLARGANGKLYVPAWLAACFK